MGFGGMSVSASALQATLVRQELVAHNVANLQTPGFKGARADSVELAGGGTAVRATPVDPRQGPLALAVGAFDLGIEGDGFFRLATPDGLRFSRAGVFGVNADGELVTPQGFRLSPSLRIPEGGLGIEVTRGGEVSARMPDGTLVPVGAIRLASFANPSGLLREGRNLFAASSASGEPRTGTPGADGLGTLVTGVLEESNVDLPREMVRQIRNLHTFRVNIRGLQAQDEALGTLLDIRR